MRLLPRFRKERVLREEVALVYQNYVAGIAGFFFSALIACNVIYNISETKEILYWITAITLVTFFSLTHYWWIKDKDVKPETKATALTISIFIDGLVWAILPLFFLSGDSAINMVTITILTAGLTAGAMTMQSHCLPVFLAYGYTSLPAVSLSFFLLEDTAYTGMGIATIIYLIVLTYFAINLEKMFLQSIEL